MRSLPHSQPKLRSRSGTTCQRAYFGKNLGASLRQAAWGTTISYIPAPKTHELEGFVGTFSSKPKTPRQGGGGLRKRWKDYDGTIYEWDYQHGNVEVYDSQGWHKGVFSFPAGEKTGDAINTRRVDP